MVVVGVDRLKEPFLGDLVSPNLDVEGAKVVRVYYLDVLVNERLHVVLQLLLGHALAALSNSQVQHVSRLHSLIFVRLNHHKAKACLLSVLLYSALQFL